MSEFKPGDKVLVQGKPYSYSTTKAKVITEEYPDGKGNMLVGIKYYYIGFETAVVNTRNVFKRSSFNMKLSKPAIVTAIVIGFIAIVGLWLAGNYNSLVVASNAVDNSKAKIDTQLERRYELIDNIVSSVEGSQAQESTVFGKIAEARKIGSSSNDASAQAAANDTIDTQIALLPRLQEQYPDLKSNEQVSKLIAELQGTANSVRESRDTYNDTVTNYNNNITSFPKNIFAGIFNFDKRELFKASAAAQTNPKVNIEKQQ